MSTRRTTKDARKAGADPRRGGTPLALADPTQYTPFFSGRDASIHCERVPLERIAGQTGTPVYVYSRASIEGAYRRLDESLAKSLAGVPHTICYAVKANSNLAILALLAKLGSGFDVVSGGELWRLRQIGVPGRRIVFSGVGKTREEIREALRYTPNGSAAGTREGIMLFNVESAAELEVLAAETARVGRRAAAAIRVNPDVLAGGHPHISTGHRQHKFGVDWDEARRLYLAFRDSPWIDWQGISAHIGSQILSLAPFRRALRRLASFVEQIERDGIELKYVDCGGGLGIRYVKEQPPKMEAYAREVAANLKTLGCHVLLEPGRILVGPAGVLLTRVVHTKQNRGKTFVVVDAGMNDFLRPALYGARHPVTQVRHPARPSGTHASHADIVGPVCETGDFLAQDWPLGEVAAGDLLAVWGTGAYGFVAASNYNARPRPPEVLVAGNRFRVIRRRESRADLLRGE